MSKHTAHKPEACIICGRRVKELLWDKRDNKLKCEDCYDQGLCLETI